MAEENAAAAAAPAPSSGGGSNKPPVLMIIIAIVNMALVGGVGFMLFQAKKKEAAEPKIEHVIKGEHEAQKSEGHDEKPFIGKVLPLETFIINLAGSKGRRIAKVNMEIEVEGEQIQEEIEKRKAQVRDIIITLLSNKTFEEVSKREGKDQLRDEIKDTVNAFLTKGKITNVYFTEFIYN